MNAEFGYKADFPEIDRYLDEQLKDGNYFIACLHNTFIKDSRDLPSFKSFSEVLDYCNENITEDNLYVPSSTREIKEQLPEAIYIDQMRQFLDTAGTMEKPHGKEELGILECLEVENFAKLHIQREVPIADNVDSFLVMEKYGPVMTMEEGRSVDIFGKYDTYNEALKEFNKCVDLHSRLDLEDRSGFRLIAAFKDVYFSLDDRGCPNPGTGVTFKDAFLKRNSDKNVYEFHVVTPFKMDDTAMMNVPHYITVDKESNTFSFLDKKPPYVPSKYNSFQNEQTPDKQKDKGSEYSM